MLISYGTGAIMAVPAHDERDFEFAKQFNLADRRRRRSRRQPYRGTSAKKSSPASAASPATARAINSGKYDGLTTAEFKEKITADLAAAGLGKKAVNYKLRDWLFSRQRFWGEPFPILHELDADGKPTGRVRAVDAKDLPVDLPHLDDFKPHGRPEPPLDKAPDDWLYPTIDGIRYKRETNTMPQWAGSCWYYLRFLDPKNDQALIDPAIEKAWMPIDLYVGGAEHAVLHLLYSRFWHKVLFDRGIVSQREPFQKLVNQGMILGENGEKMSKSRGNVINPDSIVKEYGADSLRLYEMFMGPLEDPKPWSMQDVNGVYNFLDRVWRLLIDDYAETARAQRRGRRSPADRRRKPHAPSHDRSRHRRHRQAQVQHGHRPHDGVHQLLHQARRPPARGARKVRAAALPLRARTWPKSSGKRWATPETLAYEPWPKFDPALARDDTIEVPVQINGKVRSKLTVPAEIDAKALEAAARADARIAELLAGKQIVKAIVVPGRWSTL